MKKLMALLPMTLIAFMALSVAPTTHAYGAGANWQLGFAGTFHSPFGNFGFWGWCAFAGVSSGTGDCQVTQYFHPAGGGGLNCHYSIDVTGWSTGTSVMLPPFLPGFFLNTGHVEVSPSSLTAPCLAAFPGPVSASGDLLGPSDTGLPAVPGHYNLNSIVGHPGELQFQVSFHP